MNGITTNQTNGSDKMCGMAPEDVRAETIRGTRTHNQLENDVIDAIASLTEQERHELLLWMKERFSK